MFLAQDVLCIAVFPELRTRFAEALVECELDEVYFQLTQLIQLAGGLVAEGLLSSDDFHQCIEEVSAALGSAPKLSSLNFGKIDPSHMHVIVGLIEASRRQVQLLGLCFDFREDAPDDMQGLSWTLMGHPAKHL